MKNLLIKELRLSASLLSYLFILFAFMVFIPGYPILISAFFVCFGIFHSFQSSRENLDILYSVLLPIRKSDVVRSKFRFILLIQLSAFVLMLLLTLLRMAVFPTASVYVNNPMMNANPFFLASVLLVYLAFNLTLLPGFFRTAFHLGKYFLIFGIEALVLIALAETLHHLPGLTFLNDTAALADLRLWAMAAGSAFLYAIGTFYACRISIQRFEQVDL